MSRLVGYRVSVALFSILSAVVPAHAQTTVSGRVVDPQGAPVANALVTVSPPAPPRTTRTDNTGEFQVLNVPGDRATLQAEAPGFATGRMEVALTSPGTTVTLTLQVAGLREAVNVTAAASLGLTQVSDAGSRLGLSILETPASVQVLEGESIRTRGDATLVGATTRAVGVTTQADPGNGGGSLAARGFGGVGSVMQLFDGDQLLVGAGTVTFPFDPWTVERVEVLNGPASVMFGSGAIGGAVNVVPRRPNTVSREHSARLAGGSFNTWRTAVDTTGPIGARASYRAELSDNRSNGWVDRGDASSTVAAASFRAELAPSLVLTASEDYGRQAPVQYFGTPSVNGTVDRDQRNVNYNVGDADISYRDNWTQGRLEWRPNPNARIRSGVQFLKTDRHWRNVENYTIVPANRVFRESYIEIFHHQKQYGNRTDAVFTNAVAGRPNTVSAGIDYNVVRFQHVNNSPYGGDSVVDRGNPTPGVFLNLAGTLPKYRTTTHRAAVFVEDRLAVSPALSLVGGVRVDRFAVERTDLITRATVERTLTPTSLRGGVVYAMRPSLSLYGQASTATDMVGNVISNSPARLLLEPTKGRQIEAGVKQAFWQQRGQWTVAGYHIVKTGLVTPDPANPGTSIQIGEQSSRGIEATLGLTWPQGISLDANVALLRARFDDFSERIGGVLVSRAGNRPANVPEQAANVWLSWQVANGWQVRGGVRATGTRYWNFENSGTVPGYAVVDAGVRRSVGRISLDLRLWNLFDTLYATTYYDNGEPQWLLGDPRSAELAVTVRF